MTTEEEFYGNSGGGAPSAKFPTIGTTVGGVIKRTKLSQQTKMETDELLYWPNGEPKMQNEIIVLTDERDPEITDDDGSRCIYVKGYMQSAVSDALADVGALKPEAGGTLLVTYTGDKASKTKGYQAAKVYEATYSPPTTLTAAAHSSDIYPDEEPF